MKWLKKSWVWLAASLTGILALVLAVVKYVLKRQDKKTAEAVTATTLARDEGSRTDTQAADRAEAKAEGKQEAAVGTVTAVTETTEPQTQERLDALAGVLNSMKRENR